MSSDKCKNDVKTLFLICNSFGFAFGWVFFASGVGIAAINGSSLPDTINIVLGIVIIFVTLIGYSGAIAENKKALRSYGTCMMMFAINVIIVLVSSKPAPRGVGHNNDDMSDDEENFVSLIFITILTLMSILLAFSLGGEIVVVEKVKNAAISDQKREENAETAVKIIP